MALCLRTKLKERWYRWSVAVALLLILKTVLFAAELVLAAPLILSWKDNSTDEIGFIIDRRVSGEGAFTKLATMGANTVSYVDGDVIPEVTYCYRVTAYNAAGPSVPSNEACATPVPLTVLLEAPENGQVVSGIGAIRGWGFDSRLGQGIHRVELLIDGSSVGELPCCSSRGDVQAAFPQAPAQNAENSGWGTEVNWSELLPGSYTVQGRITGTDGKVILTNAHTVSVVRPGSSSVVDVFTLAKATVQIEHQELVLNQVRVRDKETQREREITARFRWSPSLQAIVLTNVEVTKQLAAFHAPVFPRLAAFVHRLWPSEMLSATPAHAATNILAMFESPESGQEVFGIGVVRGWAFVADQTVSIRLIRLVVDGQQITTIPCCSARTDVAAALSNTNALTSGWGMTVNYAGLSVGSHSIEIQLESTAGTTTSLTRQVWVVKKEGFEFIDQFDLSDAIARIEGEEVIVSEVRIRDKASQQTATVELRLRWLENTQTLGIVAIN